MLTVDSNPLINGPARVIVRKEFLGYFAASVVALTVDLILFSVCFRVLHLSWPPAAAIGFTVGVTVAYLLSVRWVFRQRRLHARPAGEFTTFLLIGVIGLGITEVVLWVGIERLNLPAEFTRIGAAGITFAFNYVVRTLVLFRVRC